MGLRKEREIGFFKKEKDGRMGYRGREWRFLMFDISGPNIEWVMERKCLHVAHHYTLGRLQIVG